MSGNNQLINVERYGTGISKKPTRNKNKDYMLQLRVINSNGKIKILDEYGNMSTGNTNENTLHSNDKKQEVVKERVTMDEGTKMMLDRLDQDIRDHKKEIIERDKQLQKSLDDREKRMLEQISQLINSQQQNFNHKMDLIDQKMDHVSSNVVDTKDEMSKVTDRIDTMNGRVDSSKQFLVGSVIALLLGVAGLVYANWQVISAMLSLSGNK